MNLIRLIALLVMLTLAGGANSQLLYYNASGSNDMGSARLDGSAVKSYTQDKGNGRGVAVIGNTLYYTAVDCCGSSVFTRRISDNADTGLAFTVAGLSSLQSIAFDGTNFWVDDYSGSTNAYLVSPTGVILKTINLANGYGLYGPSDSLEYFNGKLIANDQDGGGGGGENTYTVYDLDGKVLSSKFIDTHGHGGGGGISFDGENFFVSAFYGRVAKYSGNTGQYIGSFQLQGGHFFIEDLSFDYAGRSDTCGTEGQIECNLNIPAVPEPSIMANYLIGIFGIFWFARHKIIGGKKLAF